MYDSDRAALAFDICTYQLVPYDGFQPAYHQSNMSNRNLVVQALSHGEGVVPGSPLIARTSVGMATPKSVCEPRPVISFRLNEFP